MNDIYILVNNENTGPFTEQELQEMVDDGEIPPETLYATSGMSTWEPLSNLLQIGPSRARSTEPLPTDYDGNRFRALKDEFRRLITYEAADDWDRRAREEISLVSTVIRGVDEAISSETARLDQAKREFESQSFFKRVWGDHNAEQNISGMISRLRQMRVLLPEIINHLQESLDITPHNPGEKTRLIKELRHRKKELQAQKRQPLEPHPKSAGCGSLTRLLSPAKFEDDYHPDFDSRRNFLRGAQRGLCGHLVWPG